MERLTNLYTNISSDMLHHLNTVTGAPEGAAPVGPNVSVVPGWVLVDLSGAAPRGCRCTVAIDLTQGHPSLQIQYCLAYLKTPRAVLQPRLLDSGVRGVFICQQMLFDIK